jgi:hypothetical protein
MEKVSEKLKILIISGENSKASVIKSFFAAEHFVASCSRGEIYKIVQKSASLGIFFELVIILNPPSAWYGLGETVLSIPKIFRSVHLCQKRHSDPKIITLYKEKETEIATALAYHFKINNSQNSILQSFSEPDKLKEELVQQMVAYKLLPNISSQKDRQILSGKLLPLSIEDKKNNVKSPQISKVPSWRRFPWQDASTAVLGDDLKKYGVFDLLVDLGLKCEYVVDSPVQIQEFFTTMRKCDSSSKIPDITAINFMFNSSKNNRYHDGLRIAANLMRQGVSVPVVMVASLVGDVKVEDFHELGRMIKKTKSEVLINFNGSHPEYVNKDKNNQRNQWVLAKTFGHNLPKRFSSDQPEQMAVNQ